MPRHGRSLASRPQVSLGSLTQRGARGAARCVGCGSPRVTSIAMNLTDGTPVEFTSCHECEERSWAAAGGELSIDRVLDKTRKV
jgi:hypothetical protein